MFPQTLGQFFQRALDRSPNRMMVTDQNKTYDYSQINELSDRFANVFLNHYAEKGNRIGILMSNCAEYLIADLAIHKIGCAKVPFNHLLTQDELLYTAEDSGAEYLVCSSEFIDKGRRILQNNDNQVKQLFIFNITDKSDMEIGIKEEESAHKLIQMSERLNDIILADENDIALIIYTGGTTGRPKGAVHTQRGLVNCLLQHMMEVDVKDGERMLFTTPVAHASGFYIWLGLLKNASVFLEQKFDVSKVLNLISEKKIEFMFMVPTMIYRLLDHINIKDYDLKSIHTIIYGGAPITANRLKQALSVFGPVFNQCYGQAEVPDMAVSLSKNDHLREELASSCGRATHMAQVEVVDEETGVKLNNGEVGEIAIKSSFNMKEYLNLPEETSKTIVDGWIRTGDIGYKNDEGYFFLLDRKKDMIISGGFNIYSTEVESVIQKHPDVVQVAVIGIPHDDWGEAVTAVVVPNESDYFDLEGFNQYCQDNLAKYKRPKSVKIVSEIPLTHYGKFDKKELKNVLLT